MDAIMGNYFLTSPDKQSLQIFNEQKEFLTELRRESYMNYKSSFTYKNQKFRFVNENVWHTKYVLLREGEAIAHISWKWTGAAFIEVRSDSGEWYCFEYKGDSMFDYSKALIDEYREEILRIRPSVNWNRCKYSLSIENSQPEKSPVDFIWLLIISLFANSISMASWGVSMEGDGRLHAA